VWIKTGLLQVVRQRSYLCAECTSRFKKTGNNWRVVSFFPKDFSNTIMTKSQIFKSNVLILNCWYSTDPGSILQNFFYGHKFLIFSIQVGCFVPGKPFQSSQMFAVKARAYPSGVPIRSWVGHIIEGLLGPGLYLKAVYGPNRGAWFLTWDKLKFVLAVLSTLS
jgi:hypothetical protein